MAALLLMLPGLLCDARMFARQRDAFPDAQVVDGFGATDSLAAMAERALAEAPPRFALLGHSMGARVALEVWRQAPERVERIAIASTGTHLPREGEAEKRHALLALGRSQGAAALVDAWLPPMIAPANRRPAIVDPLHAMCVDVGVESFAAQIAALLGRPEVDSLLPDIDVPALVIVGAEDLWAPPGQHAPVAAALPQAEFVVVPGAGHMLPAEAPDAFNDAVRAWLDRPLSQESTR